MDNHMNQLIKTYQKKSELIDDVSADVVRILSEATTLFGSGRMLLSGGGTPGPIYTEIAGKCDFLNSVQIGLIDERFVPTNSEYSNERLIRDCLSRKDEKVYNIRGMVEVPEDRTRNLNNVRKRYKSFVERTDVAILGMGKDGHIASIFPGDPASKEAREDNVPGFFNTNAPAHPEQRVSCGMELIRRVHHLYLVIFGEEKLQVLKNLRADLPIHDITKSRPDIKIYFLENE